METILQLTLYLLLLTLAVLLTWQRARAHFLNLTSREYSRQVEGMFWENWNGTEEDRIPAWERTAISLEVFDWPPEMAIEARLRLEAERAKNTPRPSTGSGHSPQGETKNVSRKKVRSGKRNVEVAEIN